MLRLVRVTGCVALVAIVWGVLMFALARNPELTKVQLDADRSAVAAVLGDADRLRDARLTLWLDFVFLCLYGTAFVLLGVLLRRRGGRYALLGTAAILTALLTVAFDIAENVLTLRILGPDDPADVSQSQLDQLQGVSYAKWGFSVLTVALLWFVFAGRRRYPTVYLIATLAGIAVVTGAYAVAARSQTWVTRYFTLLTILLLTLCPQLAIPSAAKKFLRGFGLENENEKT